jgi:hypothetical protein
LGEGVAVSQAVAVSHRHRVPVEHRVFGLDRRTFPFAVTALAVWLLWVVVAPAIDDAVPWNDAVQPGDALQVTSTVTMIPAVGWGIQSGLRTSDRTASGRSSEPIVLVNDGVSFGVMSGPWTGTPTGLLQQSTLITGSAVGPDQFRLAPNATTIQTRGGTVGVLEGFTTPTVEGLVAAFVFDDIGVQIQVAGTPQHLAMHAEEIGTMIESFGSHPGPA